MDAFQYAGDALCCEGVPVADVADAVGTPVYIYSRAALERRFAEFERAFAGVDHLVCYSVKANSNLAVLRTLARLGAGVDVVSGGEIYRALQAGVPPAKMVYSGVGKSRDEIRYALEQDILMFNVESLQELDTIDSIAGELGKIARVSLRVNPDVDPKTHPYISTGMKKNKFGIAMEAALDAYREAAGRANLEVAGLDCHIGSQIVETAPFVDALQRVRAFLERLAGAGITIRYLDIGGGLGITYDDEAPPAPQEYARAIAGELEGLGCTLVLEPGRAIAGNAGILVTRVAYTKQAAEKRFIIVDAAMNDLVRPSLYEAFHGVLPVRRGTGETVTADIVGPVCESGDFLARGRAVPDAGPGDLLAVMSAGAYGFTMSSNYNSRPRVPEVLVDGDCYHVVRRRETYEDLVRLEHIPEPLR